MIDWKTKLCSRKLWAAFAGLITGLLLLFGVDKSETEQIGGIVLTAGSVIAYILGEGLADAAGAANPVIWEEYDEDDGEYEANNPPDEE